VNSVTIADVRAEPFAHSTATEALSDELAAATLRWMERDARWKLRVADFYEQWELHLDHSNVPEPLQSLLEPAFVENLARTMFGPIVAGDIELCEVTAHKLLEGQTIRLHNDYLEDAESHRILIQLNQGWRDDQGGLLMLFGSDSSADVRRIVRPLHRSAFAFPISDRSFHAVSTIAQGQRYTLVYSFRAASGAPA
jgi:Rps23 Pro-64 3,4-dihydroxylase Tpa1-like proline 4-hydroxylase